MLLTFENKFWKNKVGGNKSLIYFLQICKNVILVKVDILFVTLSI